MDRCFCGVLAGSVCCIGCVVGVLLWDWDSGFSACFRAYSGREASEDCVGEKCRSERFVLLRFYRRFNVPTPLDSSGFAPSREKPISVDYR